MSGPRYKELRKLDNEPLALEGLIRRVSGAVGLGPMTGKRSAAASISEPSSGREYLSRCGEDEHAISKPAETAVARFHLVSRLPETMLPHHREFKSLVHAFLAFAEGLCHAMRRVVKQFRVELGAEVTRRDMPAIEDLALGIPLSRSVRVGFRNVSRLFGAYFTLDTGGADYRAFAAMIEARGRFTHPKKWSDLQPFELLATMKWGMQWFLLSWGELLIACTAQVGDSIGQLEASLGRAPFEDRRLTAFQDRRREYDAAHRDDSSLSDLSRVIFGLLDDTIRAVKLVTTGDDQPDRVSAELAFRNLTRFLFSEIEGSVFIAAIYLYRYGYLERTSRRENFLLEITKRCVSASCRSWKRFHTSSGTMWFFRVVVRAGRHSALRGT